MMMMNGKNTFKHKHGKIRRRITNNNGHETMTRACNQIAKNRKTTKHSTPVKSKRKVSQMTHNQKEKAVAMISVKMESGYGRICSMAQCTCIEYLFQHSLLCIHFDRETSFPSVSATIHRVNNLSYRCCSILFAHPSLPGWGGGQN